jgi:hypothetical protein
MSVDHKASAEFLIEHINPEPWSAPEISLGRRGGKLVPMAHTQPDQRGFQTALAEAFEKKYGKPCIPKEGPDPKYSRIEFYFWREVPEYEIDGRTQHGNYADTTNLQKSTEDALQGLLYLNDRQLQDVRSVIVAQGPGIEPAILVRCYTPKLSRWDNIVIIATKTRKRLGGFKKLVFKPEDNFLEGRSDQF